jgi:hypothetical protein
MKCKLTGANKCLLMVEGPTVERHFLRFLLMPGSLSHMPLRILATRSGI